MSRGDRSGSRPVNKKQRRDPVAKAQPQTAGHGRSANTRRTRQVAETGLRSTSFAPQCIHSTSNFSSTLDVFSTSAASG